MTQVLVLEETSKEDFFVCGLCKSVFTYLPLFLDHKRNLCRKEQVPEVPTIVENTLSIVSGATSSASNFITSTTNLSKPLKIKPSNNTFCKYCNKPFEKLKSLLVHMKTHNGRPYQCLVCGRCFSQNSHLLRHEMSHKVWPGGLTETTVKTADVDSMSYSCTYCNKILCNYSQFRGHLKDHLSLKKLKCVQGDCVKLFDNSDQLLSHVRTEHKELFYTCHICLKSFKSLEDIAAHQQNHINTNRSVKDTRKYKCAQCDACFKRKDKLTLHLAMENHNKRCIQCAKVFASDKRLRLHLQTHRNNKPFHCDICGSSFHMKKYLASHLLKHGERQFVCTICNYQFKRKDLLQRHMKVHLDKKKITCPFRETLGCKIEFTRNDKFKSHLTNHTKKLNNRSNKKGTQDELHKASTMEILIVPLCDNAYTEPHR